MEFIFKICTTDRGTSVAQAWHISYILFFKGQKQVLDFISGLPDHHFRVSRIEKHGHTKFQLKRTILKIFHCSIVQRPKTGIRFHFRTSGPSFSDSSGPKTYPYQISAQMDQVLKLTKNFSASKNLRLILVEGEGYYRANITFQSFSFSLLTLFDQSDCLKQLVIFRELYHYVIFDQSDC